MSLGDAVRTLMNRLSASSTEQHNRANPIRTDVGESAPSCKHGRVAPISHLSCGILGGVNMPSPQPC